MHPLHNHGFDSLSENLAKNSGRSATVKKELFQLWPSYSLGEGLSLAGKR